MWIWGNVLSRLSSLMLQQLVFIDTRMTKYLLLNWISEWTCNRFRFINNTVKNTLCQRKAPCSVSTISFLLVQLSLSLSLFFNCMALFKPEHVRGGRKNLLQQFKYYFTVQKMLLLMWNPASLTFQYTHGWWLPSLYHNHFTICRKYVLNTWCMVLYFF